VCFYWTSCALARKRVLLLDIVRFGAKACAFTGYRALWRESVCFYWTSCALARKRVLLLDIVRFGAKACAFTEYLLLFQ